MVRAEPGWLELESPSSTLHLLTGPEREGLPLSMHCCPLPLYLITQPVLIDLGFGVTVVHGHLLAQDVEGVL